MSDSPPKNEQETEPGAQSGEEPDQMDREQEGVQQGLGDFEVKEQDRWLPIANVARIMKTALPENAKIAKEAKECMQECVSEFISFITSEASEKCQQEKRKTVNGEDILFAMTSLGFENYAEALKIYLTKYREYSEHRTDWDETQSARGENQNRPTSSGGPGGGYATGGPVGSASGNPATAAGQSSVFSAGQPETAGTILSPTHGLDTSEHDGPASYGYPGMVSTGHNGTGAESY